MSLQPLRPMRARRRVLEVEVARLQNALQALSAARTTADTGVDLSAVLGAVWRVLGDDAWTVADLRDRGLVRADQTSTLGHALARAATDGLPVGGVRVERLGESRAGRVWILRRPSARQADASCFTRTSIASAIKGGRLTAA